MGFYQRSNGIYYFRKTVNKRLIRFSLQTKKREIAKERYYLLVEKIWDNQVNGVEVIPLFENYKGSSCNKKTKQINLNRPSLEIAFKEHIRLSKSNFVSDDSLNFKKQLLKYLKAENIQWDNITPEKMIDFQEKLRLNYAHSTVDKYITHLKAFLKFAVKRNYFHEHDRVRIDFLKRSKPKKVQPLISEDDLQKMLQYCKDRGDLDFLYYLITLFFTASRPNEIVKMTYKDIDFENLRVAIWMNKTKRYKHVAFDKEFLDELMGVMKFNELTNGCLFLGSIRSNEFYAKKFREMKRELNLNEDYTLYSFRRTAGTKCMEFAQNIHLVAEFLGHEDIRHTKQSYILDNPERTRPLHNHLKDLVYPKKSYNNK